MASSATVDVSAVIDRSAIGWFQYRVFFVLMLIMLCDGFDTQSVAYVAPSLVAEWHLPPGTLGPVFASVLLGAMLGSFLFGTIADRIGRRHTLALCTAAFGALNFASAYTTSIESFTILRFLCGVGLGGAIPNVTALIAEYAPLRKRATLVATTWCGFALGAVLGGLVSVGLIAKYGWMSVFVVGGILPLLILPLIITAIPDSIKFLILANENGAAVTAILRKIAPNEQFDAGSLFVLQEKPQGRGRVSALFKDGRAAGSICLCLAFALSLTLVYLLISWIPLLLRQAGLPLQHALMGTVIFNLAGIAGSIACTQLIDRKVVRPIPILMGAYFIGAIAVFSIGLVQYSLLPIMATIFLSGFFIIGVQLSLNAYITDFYPTAIRGTGVGWSQVFGRSGSLLGPVIGGILVARGTTPDALFQISSAAPFLAGVSLLVFAWLSRSREASQTEFSRSVQVTDPASAGPVA